MEDQEKMQDQVDQVSPPQAAADVENTEEVQAAPSLEAKLASAEAKAAEMQDAFLRAKADGENIRRRAQEDVAKAHKFAIENFAEALVPVKDSLEMALKLDTLQPSIAIVCRKSIRSRAKSSIP